MKKIIDCETGQVIERELTNEEIAQREIDNLESEARAEAKQAEAQAKATAKAALLNRLGITEDEARLLLA